MSRFAVLAVLAALGAALLVTSASAFDHHFRVLAKRTWTRAGPNANAIRFEDKLVDLRHRRDRVGRDHWKCRVRRHRVKCHAFIHLNGKIGGIGAIRVRGDIKHNDDHLRVLGGSRQFNGVAGKLTRKGSRLLFDLVR